MKTVHQGTLLSQAQEVADFLVKINEVLTDREHFYRERPFHDESGVEQIDQVIKTNHDNHPGGKPVHRPGNFNTPQDPHPPLADPKGAKFQRQTGNDEQDKADHHPGMLDYLVNIKASYFFLPNLFHGDSTSSDDHYSSFHRLMENLNIAAATIKIPAAITDLSRMLNNISVLCAAGIFSDEASLCPRKPAANSIPAPG